MDWGIVNMTLTASNCYRLTGIGFTLQLETEQRYIKQHYLAIGQKLGHRSMIPEKGQ